MSSPAPSSRTSLIAAASGVLLLALVLGFAIGLPEIAGDGEGEGATTSSGAQVDELAPLPDTLPGGLTSLLGPDMPEELVASSGGKEQLTAVVESASENLAELYGEPTAFGIYGSVEGTSFVTVVVGPGEPGLFVPDGPPVSADVQQAARANLDVVKVGDAACSVLFDQAVPAGQPVDPDELPARVHCQLGSSGLLYDVTAQGLSVDDTVVVAEAVRELEEETPAA